MLMDLQNLQPVDPVPDSTESTESRGQTEYLQSEVDKYAEPIVDLIIDDPCNPVPEILRRPGRGGGRQLVAQFRGKRRTFVRRITHV